MVTSVSSTTKINSKVTSNGPKRPPLLPSEAQNNDEISRRKPKYKEVTSRYLSTSSISSVSTTSSSNTSTSTHSSSRSPSPMMLTRTPTVKRSQSVDRRRPVMTPEMTSAAANRRRPEMPVTTTSAAAQLLLKSSRSLSVSFQGESYSMAVSKAKPSPATNNVGSVRKGKPERRRVTGELVTPVRDRTDNVKPSDQHRWPGRSKPLNSCFLTQSLDCGGTTDNKSKFGSGSVVRSSMNSVIDLYDRARIEVKLKAQNDNDKVDIKSADAALNSDSESVSSGSTSGGSASVTQRKGGGPRGIVVPARVWQETDNRIRRGGLEQACSHVDKNGTLKTAGNKKFPLDTSTASPRGVPTSRGLGSPLRGGGLGSPLRGGDLRPASLNKASMTPSASSTALRGMPSPTRIRNGVMGSLSSNISCVMPSMLSFAADARRGKVGENRILDAHELRLLYNRHLQWRFINARAEAALKSQTATAERNLYNAWLTTLKLRNSVESKKIQLQLLQQNMKLYSILKGQGPCLEKWSIIEENHCNSLSGAICALEASTIRLPVVEGAKAEVQNVKDAISSAVDVMQAMGSSLCSLLPKVEQVDSMAYELASVVAHEHALLDHCYDLLSSVSALQVKECSLRTHLLQLKDAGSCSTKQV